MTKQLFSGVFVCFLLSGCIPFSSDVIDLEQNDNAGIQHLGLIMDGNRRWAKERGLQPWEGHRAGAKSLEQTIDFCIERKISHLTVYAFSIENFKRSEEELSFLFNVLAQEIADEALDRYAQKGVKIKFIGDRDFFPLHLIEIIDNAQHKTIENEKLQLNILFCYGGRHEIISGVKNMVNQVQQGTISPEEINDETFSQCLWTAGIPAPDLVIRAGKEKRLSNFLLYALAYAELYFTDCYWPDINQKHLQKIISEFKSRKRNFGK